MNGINRLTKYILISFYREWLSAVELCLLDTAFCSSIDRDQFISLVDGGTLHDIGILNSCTDVVSIQSLCWMARKKMFVGCISMEPSLLLLKIDDITRTFSKLSSLTFTSICIGRQYLSFLSTYANLTELVIVDCEALNDDKCAHPLTTIRFGLPDNWKYDNSYQFAEDEHFSYLAKRCPLLRKLILCGFSEVSDATMDAFCRNCVDLTELTIARMQDITQLSLHLITTHCQNIQKLALIRCKEIDFTLYLNDSLTPMLQKAPLQDFTFVLCNHSSHAHFKDQTILAMASRFDLLVTR